MSNPAVITLAEVNTSGGRFRVEDNIGESIHLHFGEIRIDLTIDEFRKMADDIYKALNIYFSNIPGFDLNCISREFLLQRSECWNDLFLVKKEKIKLSEMLVDVEAPLGFVKYSDISKSRVTKALNGRVEENNRRRERNYYGQTNQERLNAMLKNIESEGYRPEKGSIILFNDRNNIIDGQHRAACLFYLYGDIEVCIQRMYFDENKHSAVASPFLEKLFHWDKQRVYEILRTIYRKIKKGKNYVEQKITGLQVRADRIRYRSRK